MVRRLPLATLVALIALVFASLVPVSASAATGNAGTVFTLTNNERSKAGLKALVSDPALDAAAQQWAEHLAKTCTFEHSSSSWRSARTSSAGWTGTGENIAAGYASPAAVMSGWMNSSGHKANILNTRYNGLGVGYATGSCYKTYYVQVFGVGKPIPTVTAGTAAVSGTPSVGTTLTASGTGWPSGTTLAYQWLSGGVAIAGATKATYVPTLSDGSRTITVKITGSKAGHHSSSVVSRAGAAVTGGASTERLSGASRYDTAAKIALEAYPNGATVAYVASGTAFPDALSAAPAAAVSGGPLLLTKPAVLAAATKDALVRLSPDRIVVVGGLNAVSTAVEQELSTIAPVTRSGGANRYATSRGLVESAFTSAPVVYIATGRGFADALTAGAAAGAQGYPVVLVNGPSSAIDADTVALLRSLGTSTVRIAGGPAAVSTGIESSLRTAGFAVERLQGGNRYATAQAINAQVFDTAGLALVASGESYPDALAGAAAAGSMGAPLFPSRRGCIPGPTEAGLTSVGPDTVMVLGGPAALSTAIDTLTRC